MLIYGCFLSMRLTRTNFDLHEHDLGKQVGEILQNQTRLYAFIVKIAKRIPCKKNSTGLFLPQDKYRARSSVLLSLLASQNLYGNRRSDEPADSP